MPTNTAHTTRTERSSRVRFTSEPLLSPHSNDIVLGPRECAIEAWRESRASVAAAEAQALLELGLVARDIVACAESPADAALGIRSFSAEVAASAHISPRTAERRVNEAHEVVRDFPLTLEALETGSLSMEHLRVIVAEASGLNAVQRAPYEAEILPFAERLTPAALRVQARRLAEATRPETTDERQLEATGERKVWVRGLEDGMAELGAELPAVLAYGIYNRLTRGAHAAKRALQQCPSPCSGADGLSTPAAGDACCADASGATCSTDTSDAADTRESSEASNIAVTVPQLRADLFAELLLTGVPADVTDPGNSNLTTSNTCPGTSTSVNHSTAQGRSVVGIVPEVTIVVPATPAAGMSHAELRGYGPINTQLAREMTAAAPGWDRVAVNAHGAILGVDRYRVSESLRRVLVARDQHCRFPGCQAPVARCDIDHTREWMHSGSTTTTNLAHLCRAHHMLKHPDLDDRIRWTVRQYSDGRLVWRSPVGHEYPDEPERPLATPPGQRSDGQAPPGSPPAYASPPAPF